MGEIDPVAGAGAALIVLGVAITLCCLWLALRPRGGFTALLDRFPGPVTIGVSIPKYLALFALCCPLLLAAILLIRSPEAAAVRMHGHARGEGMPHLLVFLHVARDMREALVQIGWAMVALFGVGALLIIRKLALSATGSRGLTLDEDGFTVRTLKLNERHRWQDVGDFDSLAVSRFIRRRYQMVPLSKSCVIFNDYRAPESPIEWLRVTGRNRALREAYEYSAEDLAKALSMWRKEALEKSLRSK